MERTGLVMPLIAMLIVFLVSAPALAVDNPYAGLAQPDAARYKACVARVASEPDVARRAAELWLENEGGVPAKHCLALALIALERPAEGAEWLEEAARDMAMRKGLDALGADGGPDLRVSLLTQAADAWILARLPDRAYRALSEALAALPVSDSTKRIEVYRDRARVSAFQGNWQQAVEDLSAALALDEGRVDLYVLRAAAHRHLGRFAAADYDLARALAIDGDNAAALLERGNLRRIEGDDAAARRDWERVAELYPGTEEGELALDNLELMRADP
ncbi:MAG: hypothetical protein D6763_09040 [Alphaproteobacteria bacterium]|nr:MAG: hypothetical protein D6763_09040 [Alphaproteobacteria bacterium]